MKTYLDGTLVEEAGDSLEQALEVVRGRLSDRLVVEALADGVPVPDSDLDEPPADGEYAQELRFTTARTGAVVAESLRQASEAIEAADERRQEAADRLAEGDVEGAMDSLCDVLRVWASVRSVAEIAVNMPEGGLDAKTVQPAAVELGKVLDALRTAIVEQDWPTAGDIVGLDLPELAARWRTLFDEAAHVALKG